MVETLKGMGVTLKNFFRKPVHVQYPEQKRNPPARNAVATYCIATRTAWNAVSPVCCVPALVLPMLSISNRRKMTRPSRIRLANATPRFFRWICCAVFFVATARRPVRPGRSRLSRIRPWRPLHAATDALQQEDLLEPLGTATRGAALAWEPHRRPMPNRCPGIQGSV